VQFRVIRNLSPYRLNAETYQRFTRGDDANLRRRQLPVLKYDRKVRDEHG